jgi:membrane protease YdiL (CAAX protease family)
MNTTTQQPRVLNFFQNHPVITFLMINFAWTWLFWLSAIPFQSLNNLLVLALVIIGGFGPALAGIITLGLNGQKQKNSSPKKLLAFIIATIMVFGVLAIRYTIGNIPNYEILAENLNLNFPILAAVILASLVGGWVISSAYAKNTNIKNRMSSIIPWKKMDKWVIFGLFFYPVLILISWLLASLFGMEIEYPSLWESPVLETLPIYLLTFVMVGLTQGGLEEPGWRGFLQPELQKRFSPLVAALIVSVFWSLWHLPLYLNGTYPGDLVSGMISGWIFRILLSIFLAWFYNRSKGNLFLMIFLHTSFNVMVNFLPTSDLWLTVLWLLIVIFIVFKDKMYRKLENQENLVKINA